MRDSNTYLAILDEGREVEAKSVILRFAQRRFGPADEATQAMLTGITDPDRLDRLIDRLIDATATSWQDLLDPP